MDEKFLEMAEAREQQLRDIGLKNAAAQMAPQTHPDFDGTHCIDCEAEIPPGRLALGRIRCVDCQEHMEKRSAYTRK